MSDDRSATTIDRNGTIINFAYGPDLARYKRDENGTVTYYIDKHYEVTVSGGVTEQRSFIDDIAVLTRTISGSTRPALTHFLDKPGACRKALADNKQERVITFFRKGLRLTEP
ncbi:MAG: hypothetical protein HKN58_02065 [Xanthomonadales bacterium]|nr:hypothetical protein [Xanthomonadales bacterium]